MDWYDREMMRLEEMLEACEITDKEYREAVRDLNEELKSIAEEEAAAAYDNVMGRW